MAAKDLPMQMSQQAGEKQLALCIIGVFCGIVPPPSPPNWAQIVLLPSGLKYWSLRDLNCTVWVQGIFKSTDMSIQHKA